MTACCAVPSRALQRLVARAWLRYRSVLVKEREMDEPRVYEESFWNAGEKKMLVAWLYDNASADPESTADALAHGHALRTRGKPE